MSRPAPDDQPDPPARPPVAPTTRDEPGRGAPQPEDEDGPVADEWRRLERQRIADERREAREDAGEATREGPRRGWPWPFLALALAAGLVAALLVNARPPAEVVLQVAGPRERDDAERILSESPLNVTPLPTAAGGDRREVALRISGPAADVRKVLDRLAGLGSLSKEIPSTGVGKRTITIRIRDEATVDRDEPAPAEAEPP